MKTRRISRFALCLALSCGMANAGFALAPPATAPASGSKTKPVYEWLKLQQQSAGILGNQDNDNFAGLYPNAMAAMCFIHEGDVARAERIFDYYHKHLKTQFAPGTPGGFPQAANAANGELSLDTDRWIGDNAWLLIALNYYHRETRKTTYDDMRRGIAEWLISLQDPNGGIKAGFNKAGPMLHYSTEGNLDCYAALVDYPEPRERVLKFLKAEMYVADGKYFKMGSTVNDPALDTCAWAVQALGPAYASTIEPTEKRFLRTDKSEANGATIHGFADFVDKSRIWLEGTGEMAVAYNVAGRPADAKHFIAELEKAMVPSKAHPGTVGIPCSAREPSWTGASTLPFTPSQGWYLFASWNFNPMATK
jgi:cellulose synthase operon protein B